MLGRGPGHRTIWDWTFYGCVGKRFVLKTRQGASRQERGSSFLSAGFEFGIQSKRRKQSASQDSDGLDAVYGKDLMSER
jgi:hypothetical protein